MNHLFLFIPADINTLKCFIFIYSIKLLLLYISL